ncbi:transcriptional regulator [Hyphomicrobium nitrativorans NL23]|uniref:Transcriptional regulator n=1 Tax=Hyphomicrobium nitrativorans NL23 TaxID=1029756 RepID=V5SCB6_9HYPH|nr:transcriptional regulator [Hyphomicrobium nitrativorans NL23]
MSKTTYLSPREAASHLGLSASTLAKHRITGTGPRFFKLGGLVKYRADDLNEWARERLFRSTTEYIEKARA